MPLGRGLPAAAVAALLLAGCFSDSAQQPEPEGPPPASVEGWVLDRLFAPVAGADISIPGTETNTTTDGQGHFTLALAPGAWTLVLRAPGFVGQSRALTVAGAAMVVNFTLERVPAGTPSILVEEFQGRLRCAFTAVVAEDPNRPHEHQGMRCDDYLDEQVTPNVWRYPIPRNATGIVFEVAWTPESQFAQSLVLKLDVEATGEILGFSEGPSILRWQMPGVVLAQLAQEGTLDIRLSILPGAGTGTHEHGAVGAFVDQPFEMFASTFYNQPADPSYSVEDGP